MDSGLPHVSRETIERLEVFSELVCRWTGKINLISPASVPDLWQRHIVDSAQIYELAPSFSHWVDLGSGGGFPGIVAAILSIEDNQDGNFTLVESDQRKATFLRTAIRDLELNASVAANRISEIDPLEADILSARALAPLDRLFDFADLHLKCNGTALFPKGKDWTAEVTKAQIQWSFNLQTHKSKTNPDAAVLKIKDIRRV